MNMLVFTLPLYPAEIVDFFLKKDLAARQQNRRINRLQQETKVGEQEDSQTTAGDKGR